ncbi:hypothetical protein SEA_SKOG_20 [Gordonia phage Skog]|uniref:Uncharacterized protein n=1 Tax=Gordonia phage Skog TaxID=2704033 RepID=A0A6G6XJ97_9CAUD|nr:hypothetical protein KHQ85_gp020 [Gordonia phage Skog]QIG58172.1 hypothetical protein SEA_SKOG_20 [Gordonia phage Skog]
MAAVLHKGHRHILPMQGMELDPGHRLSQSCLCGVRLRVHADWHEDHSHVIHTYTHTEF